MINSRERIPTVFVVDPDSPVRQGLALLIRTAGWHVEAFGSAEEFLARPRAMSPSCLITDIRLPQLDGLELQEMIADRVETPVL